MRRDVVIEIFSPTEGLHTDLPSSIITPRSSPAMRAANAYFGVVQKEYGTSLFSASTGAVMGAPTSLIYQADFPGNSVLEAFTHTGMLKYAAGTFASDGQVYSGTFTDAWSACIHNDVMVYANGVDLVQCKPTYSATGDVMGGVATSSYKAYAVVSFKEHLNLYHTYEAGNECFKRVRWTKVGTLGYNGADWTAGTAGFLDIADMEGKLMTAAKLGPVTAVYAENSIHVQEWVGGADVYRFTKMINGRGVPSRRSVAVNDSVHYVLTLDGVYEYYGGREIKEISYAIRSRWVSIRNNAAMAYAFIQYIKDDNEIRAYIPTGASTYPDTCFICKIDDNYAWYETKVDYTSYGQFTRQSALTIGELVGKIGAQNWKFGDMSINAGAPAYLLGDQTGRVVKMDKTLYSLSASGTSVPQSFYFDGKDFTSVSDIDPMIRDRYHLSKYMDNNSRWVQIIAELKGNGTATMQYSTDEGSTYANCPEGAKTISNTWKMYYWDIDAPSPRLRPRLLNTSTNEAIHLRYWKVQFVPGAEAES